MSWFSFLSLFSFMSSSADIAKWPKIAVLKMNLSLDLNEEVIQSVSRVGRIRRSLEQICDCGKGKSWDHEYIPGTVACLKQGCETSVVFFSSFFSPSYMNFP